MEALTATGQIVRLNDRSQVLMVETKPNSYSIYQYRKAPERGVMQIGECDAGSLDLYMQKLGYVAEETDIVEDSVHLPRYNPATAHYKVVGTTQVDGRKNRKLRTTFIRGTYGNTFSKSKKISDCYYIQGYYRWRQHNSCRGPSRQVSRATPRTII